MKITALTENTSENDLECEHGLSLFIETERHTVLFDMGQSELFAVNAEKLGLDLKKVDIAVLSHGHYDHGGGLRKFLDINDRAKVYMSRYAFEPHYNGTEKYIGLDVGLKNRSQFVYTDGVTEIDDGLTLHSCNARRKVVDLGSFGLNGMENGEFVPDDFRHEQYLLIEEDGKRVLISGCSHKGIVNIEEWFKPDVLVGGFHLSKLEPGNTLKSIAERLNSYNTSYFTCHCTGEAQYRYMKGIMERLGYLSAGDNIIV